MDHKETHSSVRLQSWKELAHSLNSEPQSVDKEKKG